jgi:hypothetical protein
MKTATINNEPKKTLMSKEANTPRAMKKKIHRDLNKPSISNAGCKAFISIG